jgi:hypothetical protein
MSVMIDTPEGIAFFRALSRNGLLKGEVREGRPMKRGQTTYSIVKEVYGLTGSRKAVSQQLDDYVQGVLTVRGWPEAYLNRLGAILNGIIDELPAGYTKDDIDHEVQGGFERGYLTEQEGNDACLLLFVDTVQKWAGDR